MVDKENKNLEHVNVLHKFHARKGVVKYIYY